MDTATIASLATAGGTLVLAIATFASVRSANRSTGLAELALQEQLRPVLVNSRLDDPEQKIMFVDQHWVRAPGGQAVAEVTDGVVYLAISLRNVGTGIAVLLGWYPVATLLATRDAPDFGIPRREHVEPDEFRILSRDLYIPPGDIGLWQGALRDPSEEIHGQLATAIAEPRAFTIELMYSDHVGGQRSITRFSLFPVQDHWLAGVTRHWSLDRPGPR
jgi:hypothetical protein